MQPDLLQTDRQKFIYGTSVWLASIILLIIVTEKSFSRSGQALVLIFSSLILWLIFGVYRIRTVENLKWSWKKGIKSIIVGLTFGAIIGTIFKMIDDLIANPLHWKIFQTQFIQLQLYSWTRGLVGGLCMGLVYGLISGFSAPSIQIQTISNQGIWRSLKNSAIFSLIGLSVLALAANMLNWDSMFWGTFGFLFGVLAGGGEACVKHFILRIILYSFGYIPWNYARFLNYATERIFLQKGFFRT